MNTFKKAAAIILAMALAVSVAGCTSVQDATDPTDATEAGINVTVAEAVVRDIETTATYTGELIAGETAYVTSKVSAKVERINVDLGDWVDEGDVLVILDDSDYSRQLTQAKAGYSQADAAYQSAVTARDNVDGVNKQTEVQLAQAVATAEIGYNDAKTNYERQKELYEKGAVSLVVFESAKSAYESASLAYEGAKNSYDITVNVLGPGNKKSAESGVTTAKAAFSTASVAVDQAKAMVAETVIKAPISGYISSKNIAIGQFAAAGTPLFTISDTSELAVEIKVTESVVPHLTRGGEAIVSVSAAGMDEIEGEISLVNPVKDAVSGMYVVRVSIDNDEDEIKAGMFADVTLITEQSESDALCVPDTAIVQTEEGNYIYVVTDGYAQLRYVECGVSDGEYTQIVDGVEEGETVVCDGKEYISETNNYVNIVE